ALLLNRTHVCAISAHPSTPTARFLSSSVRWNVRRDCYTTLRPSRNSTSSTLCWRSLRPRCRTPHSLPRCSRERWSGCRPRADTGAAPAKNVGSAYCANRDAVAAKACADDLRGCALGRPNQLGSVRSSCRPHSDTEGAVASDVPAGIRCAVGWTALRHDPHHQSTGRTRSWRHDRPRRRRQPAIAEHSAGHHRAYRRYSVIRREMTKAVLEAGSETAAERTVAAVPSPTLAVPASLYASLMARLDRLGGPAKELAQIAAAIGREFSHALLASVVRQPEAAVRSALDRLIA